MFIAEHEEVGQFVLTYVNGDDYSEDSLGAITDRDEPAYFASEDLPHDSMNKPLNCLARSKYLRNEHAGEQDFSEYAEDIHRNKTSMPQEILERLGEKAHEKGIEQELERDSGNSVDIKQKMDILAHKAEPVTDYV